MDQVFIPIAIMAAPVLIILILMRYRFLRTQARYQTLLQLADKGVALSPELLVEPQVVDTERRRGLVLVSGGLGIAAMLIALPGHFDSGQSVSSLWGLGLLPLMTGLGYLASWWLNRRGNARG